MTFRERWRTLAWFDVKIARLWQSVVCGCGGSDGPNPRTDHGGAVIRALRLVAITTAVTLAVDLAVAYWWLSFGPIPEDAFSLVD